MNRLSQSRAARAAARRLRARDAIEHTADGIRLRIDSLSDPVYQPVEELGRHYLSADRSVGTASRWAAMRPMVEDLHVRTAADVGCNAGWFTLALGRLGVAAVGVEGHPPYYRAAITAVRRSGLRNVGILTIEVRPDTVGLLPKVDCMLFLSVWHHVVRLHGLEEASTLLRGLWRQTEQVMFFETGEYEEFESTDFGLPRMLPDARHWLTSYLLETCEDAEVLGLGVHPSGAGQADVVRNLLAVRRVVG